MSGVQQKLLKYTIFSASNTVWTDNEEEETPENGGGAARNSVIILRIMIVLGSEHSIWKQMVQCIKIDIPLPFSD